MSLHLDIPYRMSLSLMLFFFIPIFLDSEMLLQPLPSHVKKIVSSKVTLSRIRRYITTNCAISIYKQTILPLFDNAGFLLISCNKKDRSDGQIIQNNCLRICYNVRLLNRLSFNEMHREANLVGLEQRLQAYSNFEFDVYLWEMC